MGVLCLVNYRALSLSLSLVCLVRHCSVSGFWLHGFPSPDFLLPVLQQSQQFTPSVEILYRDILRCSNRSPILLPLSHLGPENSSTSHRHAHHHRTRRPRLPTIKHPRLLLPFLPPLTNMALLLPLPHSLRPHPPPPHHHNPHPRHPNPSLHPRPHPPPLRPPLFRPSAPCRRYRILFHRRVSGAHWRYVRHPRRLRYGVVEGAF
jgi:hypothetical protein